MITDLIGKSGLYMIKFNNIYGSGWDDDLKQVIEKYLKPIKLSKRIIEESWDYSEIEFDLEKEDIKFILHLDDEVSASLKLISPETDLSKQKLREWAIIIAKEVEKLKKQFLATFGLLFSEIKFDTRKIN